MRVIFDDIIFMLQRSGGISKVWYELLKRAVADDSFDKRFLEYENQNIFQKTLNLPNERVVFPENRPIFERYLPPKTHEKENAIFHSSYFRFSTQKNVKNVTTIHDFTYNFYCRRLPKWVHVWQEKWAINHSEGIICVSENTKKDLLNFYPKIDEKRVRVIYNGVDEHFFRLNESSDLKDIIPFESDSYLLYVGNRVAKYKNFNLTVEVAKCCHLPLVVVGTPLSENEKNYLQSQLGNQFFNVCDACGETLNVLYNNAFALLYPSLYEGFGIPILEAQKAGCPVICLDVSSIPEVAGKGAIKIESHPKTMLNEIIEAVNRLKNKQIDIEKLRQEGYLNAEKFSWDKTYQQTIEFYREINKK